MSKVDLSFNPSILGRGRRISSSRRAILLHSLKTAWAVSHETKRQIRERFGGGRWTFYPVIEQKPHAFHRFGACLINWTHGAKSLLNPTGEEKKNRK